MFLSDISETIDEENQTGKAIKRVRRPVFSSEQRSGNFTEKRNLSDMPDPPPKEKAQSKSNYNAIIQVAFLAASGLNVSRRNTPKSLKIASVFLALVGSCFAEPG